MRWARPSMSISRAWSKPPAGSTRGSVASGRARCAGPLPARRRRPDRTGHRAVRHRAVQGRKRNQALTDQPTKFQIFRAATAPTLAQADVLRYEGFTPAIADGLKTLGDAGIGDGSFAKILFNAPGFALAYAWPKSDFPLPLHSHASDCLYLVLAGEMR